MLRRMNRMTNLKYRGFTLIEMIIAVGIFTLIGGSILAITSQIFKLGDQSDYRLIATKQVEHAVDAISRDAAMVQYPYPLAPIDASGFTNTAGTANLLSPALYLGYTTWQNATYVVTYWIQNGQLNRREYKNGVQQSQAKVAGNVMWTSGSSNSPTRFSYASNVLTFTITCTVGTGKPVTESRTFQIIPRQ
jgi:prepilin-type N-terminal cleavage/methylation domain-containing protein